MLYHTATLLFCFICMLLLMWVIYWNDNHRQSFGERQRTPSVAVCDAHCYVLHPYVFTYCT